MELIWPWSRPTRTCDPLSLLSGGRLACELSLCASAMDQDMQHPPRGPCWHGLVSCQHLSLEMSQGKRMATYAASKKCSCCFSSHPRSSSHLCLTCSATRCACCAWALPIIQGNQKSTLQEKTRTNKLYKQNSNQKI